MEDPKHPYDLDRVDHLDQATNRIAGFIGGGIAGVVIGIVVVVVLAKFSLVPLGFGIYGLIGSTVFFAIAGAIWPKWFSWTLDILSFW